MKKRFDNIIRVGDNVKIINPAFFIRCGYETHYKGFLEEIEATQMPQIYAFIVEMMGYSRMGGVIFDPPLEVQSPYYNNTDERVARRIAGALAYQKLLDSPRSTGAVRKIYTECYAEKEGAECLVAHIKYVKTGVYQGSYDEDALSWLSCEKTHKILELRGWGCPMQEYFIEATNVEKLKPFVPEQAILKTRS